MIDIIVPGQINFFNLVLESFLPYNKTVATNTTIEEEKMTENRYELNKNLAQMLKGGVIMDVQNPEQARIAEAAGAAAVMALERIPADIRAAGGVATPADAALMMQLGAEGVFVGSGIFKSGDPVKRAAAIVKAVTNYQNPQILAQISEDLGEAMVGINENEIQILMAERGK